MPTGLLHVRGEDLEGGTRTVAERYRTARLDDSARTPTISHEDTTNQIRIQPVIR
jgi:hypothetical protein